MIGFAIGAATLSAGAIIFAGLLLSVYLNQPGPGIVGIIGAAIMIALIIRLLPEYRRDQDRKETSDLREMARIEREHVAAAKRRVRPAGPPTVNHWSRCTVDNSCDAHADYWREKRELAEQETSRP